ncbi:MAG TPA: glycosyltransferase [Longimicrobiales bacterium]
MSRRVLVVANMWPSESRPADGIFVKEQIDALRRVAPDHDFDVLVLDTMRDRREYLRAPIRIARRVRQGYDVVHAHYGLVGSVAVAQRRAPVVTTFHGSDVNIPWQRRVSSLAARLSVRSIFVSKALRDRMGESARHPTVIPCGVDLDLFRPRARDAARAALGIAPDRLLVVFPGHPDNPAKDYPLFEATLAALPESVRARVDQRAITGLERDEVALLLSGADLLLLTSAREGSPMVVKEALACDTPVVAVDVGDAGELLAGVEGCRVVRGRNPALIAAAAAEVLVAPRVANGARRGHLLERALDADAIARRVLEVYDDVVAGRR